MYKPKGFTLIELLVVISVIALLMSILMPALQRARKQAKAIMCQSNLKQWGMVVKMVTDDNNGFFSKEDTAWPQEWLDYYYEDKKLLICPSAAKPAVPPAQGESALGGRMHAWSAYGDELFIGSYALSQWVTQSYENVRTPEKNWKTPNVKGAAYAPLLVDGARWACTPLPQDQPPEYDGQTYYSSPSHVDEIRVCCLNRHDYYINGVFLDFHTEKIGLKQLWKLKWHREWPQDAGPRYWPEWMSHLRDY